MLVCLLISLMLASGETKLATFQGAWMPLSLVPKYLGAILDWSGVKIGSLLV